MLVQVNTDNTLSGTDQLTGSLEARIQHDIGRFADWITRVEVHFSDESARAGEAGGVRCSIEARIANRPPETVNDKGPNLEQAFAGAIKKLRRTLDSSLGRVTNHKGGASIRGT